jgi:RNA polymerase sigma-70 factor (ECF subfamily)
MAEKEINDLINKYSKKVYNLAFRVTGSKFDADDVVQETFLQVYKNLDNFKGKSKIYTWIYRIALNNSLKKKSSLNKEYMESIDEKIDIFKDDIPPEVNSWSDNPEKAYLMNELVSEIHKGCLHFMSFILPEEQRTTYILKNVLDLSYDEISEMLGVSKNVIKARLNRARKNLKEYFSKRCKWIDPQNTCSCESRIGFGLAYDPELLRRVKMQAIKKDAQTVYNEDDKYKKDIDDLYNKLPPIDYDGQDLKEKILTSL